MKSRLITALAIGALAAGMLPGVASADPGLSCELDAQTTCVGATAITVTVTEGTTIIAPASVAIGSAFPGQMVTSGPQSISWWSNQQGMTIFADLVADPFYDADNDDVKDVDEVSFAEANVELGSDDSHLYDVSAYDEMRAFGVAPVPVQDIEFDGSTDESASSGHFKLEVHVPQATEGTYEAAITYTVAGN